MKKKLVLFILMVMACTGCTELAILTSGAGIAVGNNVYAKAYGGLDFLTIIRTEKDIKTHLYETIRHAD